MEIIERKRSKSKFGQYFTPRVIAEFMVDLAATKQDAKVLEPSCGEGVFLDLLAAKGYTNITAFEVDKTLANDFLYVRYESFVSGEADGKYDLVIGNPPYIRWANLEAELKEELAGNDLWNRYFNSLCDYLYIFILKSIELLEEGGKLVFICPEYWMNTTHSLPLRNYMAAHGYFESIYHFNETPIFEKVAVSIIIFKYIKTGAGEVSRPISVTRFHSSKCPDAKVLLSLREAEDLPEAEYLSVPQFRESERWLMASERKKEELKYLERACVNPFSGSAPSLFNPVNAADKYHRISEFCDIGNGLVSGLDKAFQVIGYSLNEAETAATIEVVKAKHLHPYCFDQITPYIFLPAGITEDELRLRYPHFYSHFQPFRQDLEQRYQYNRHINYWDWVFLRNLALFRKDEQRIFVPCKERISNKDFFRFAIADSNIYPTQDVTAIFRKPATKESVEYITAYLNHPKVFAWLKYNGVVKGNIVEFSEAPIASIPFRAISWEEPQERILHDRITTLVKGYNARKDASVLLEITTAFDLLLNQAHAC